MRLQLMTWPEVETYLSHSRVIVLPIGSTEQHGPTGLMGTDAICAEILAWGVGEAVGAVVAPTLSVGMSGHHMEFAGSMTLRPSTLLLLVHDVVLSLARHGFRRFFCVNGHGGNTPILAAAFSELYDSAPRVLGGSCELRCTAVEWWQTSAAERLSNELFGPRDGDHASASEVSLALFVHPDQARLSELGSEAPATSSFYGPEDFRRRFPDGRMGSDPSLASADRGRLIYESVVEELAESCRAFMDAE